MDRFLEMQTFITVIDSRSFVGAANALGLSKAAVSRHVNELESRLGVRLLHRTTRRLSLTAEGAVFAVRCRELLAGLDDAEAEITSRSTTARGLLRINVPVTYGIRRLAPLWGAFRERHPEVELDITLADRMVDLVEEGFDLAIRIGALHSSSLVSRRLTTTRLLMCASPEYLKAHGTPTQPNELTGHKVIGYSYLSGGDEWQLQGPDGPVRVRMRASIYSNNGDTCRAVALAGQGIILQPDFVVGDDINHGRLTVLLPDFTAGERGVYAVYPSRRHIAPKVRALIDFLTEQFAC